MRLAPLGVVLLLATACSGTRATDAATRRRAAAERDGAFAGVQARGEHAMGVDQYTSTHVFEPLPDGGRIALQRDAPDSTGAVQIRQHMQRIATPFKPATFRSQASSMRRTSPVRRSWPPSGRRLPIRSSWCRAGQLYGCGAPIQLPCRRFMTSWHFSARITPLPPGRARAPVSTPIGVREACGGVNPYVPLHTFPKGLT
jgi:hypothetical protein